ncbi:hypothetical protein EB796_003550 [Bugula neritina]|uniref:Fringe-like glycosyltransferase domain-containing protein n=1 Tax=Bugula neritina TaxID=10212 RepID=A0A7J7KJN6_BUGNE|nr:hypothetical protein EB796_003550 [Bugula neritina]
MYCKDVKKYIIALCSLSVTSLLVVYHSDSKTCRSDSIEQSYSNAVKVLNSVKYSNTQLQSTPKDSSLYIEKVFIALNTTRKFHSQRVQLLLDTWITQAKQSFGSEIYLVQYIFSHLSPLCPVLFR